MNQHFLNLKAQVEALAEKVEGLKAAPCVDLDDVLKFEELEGAVQLLEEAVRNVAEKSTNVDVAMAAELTAMREEFDERLKALEAKPAPKSATKKK